MFEVRHFFADIFYKQKNSGGKKSARVICFYSFTLCSNFTSKLHFSTCLPNSVHNNWCLHLFSEFMSSQKKSQFHWCLLRIVTGKQVSIYEVKHCLECLGAHICNLNTTLLCRLSRISKELCFIRDANINLQHIKEWF